MSTEICLNCFKKKKECACLSRNVYDNIEDFVPTISWQEVYELFNYPVEIVNVG